MAVNKKLEEVVFLELYRYCSSVDPVLKMMADGEEKLGSAIIKSQAEIRVDEKHKVRVHFAYFIGYGYDLKEKNEGTPAKEIYERAVNATKKFGGMPHMEKLVKEGVVSKRYGWYITSLRQ